MTILTAGAGPAWVTSGTEREPREVRGARREAVAAYRILLAISILPFSTAQRLYDCTHSPDKATESQILPAGAN